ncbi:MAG: protoheme IX farnesyltransferase [candidate division KSB1 bacterium]|nr:protoheme IX farnesyltransferase [candidate division KSB1 bacterium]
MIKDRLTTFFALIKLKITTAVALTTAVGYVLAVEQLSSQIFIPMLGIWLLACGSSALNELQERTIDGLMRRTRQRPLPAHRIETRTAVVIIMILSLAGTLVLYFGTNLLATVLGLFALIWYNGVYTPLKRKTAFAAVPGALIGAIPPMVGWVAGGGNIFDPTIVLIASFFFIWQVPHFWLLLMLSGDDYQRAGLPSLTRFFSMAQIARITFIWTLTTALAALIIINFIGVESIAIKIAVLMMAAGLVWQASTTLQAKQRPWRLRHAFIGINIFALLVTLFLAIDKLMNI